MIKHKRSGSELYHNFNVDHVQHVRTGEDGEIVGIDDYRCDQVAFAEEGETGYMMLETGEEIKGHIVFVIIDTPKPSESHDFTRQAEDRVHRCGKSKVVNITYLDEIGHEGWEEKMRQLFEEKKVEIHDISLGPVVEGCDRDILLTTIAESMHPNINATFRTSRDPKTAAALGQPDPDHEPYADPRIREAQEFDSEGYVYLPDHVLEKLEAAGDSKLRDDHHSDHSVLQGFASQVLNTVRNRGSDYGTPSENHELTAEMLSAWFSRKFGDAVTLTAEDVCMINIIQKVSRLAYTSKDDSYLDIAGYCENVAMLTPEQRRR